MFNKPIRNIIAAFLVLFMPVAFCYGADEAAEADQQILEFDLAGFSKDGTKTWDVTGDSADIFASVVNLNDVIANVYGQGETMKLTADKGSLDKNTGFVHLEDNVVAVSSSGGRLTSESLDWDQKNQLIATEDIVYIQRDSIDTVSKGAKAQPDLKKVYLKEDVTVKIQQQKDAFSMIDVVEKTNQPIVITCDGPLEIEYDINVATFYNNVHVVESPENEIFCDRMVMNFDYKSKKINTINSYGNVKIFREGNVSYSEEAVYTDSDKKITLLGDPKLIIYSEGGLDAALGN